MSEKGPDPLMISIIVLVVVPKQKYSSQTCFTKEKLMDNLLKRGVKCSGPSKERGMCTD